MSVFTWMGVKLTLGSREAFLKRVRSMRVCSMSPVGVGEREPNVSFAETREYPRLTIEGPGSMVSRSLSARSMCETPGPSE